MRVVMTVGQLCRKLGMSRQNYYKSRQERQRHEVDNGLIERLVLAERARYSRVLRAGNCFIYCGPNWRKPA
jgi:hypothetical protein